MVTMALDLPYGMYHKFNIGSGIGLMLLGHKPLPEPLLNDPVLSYHMTPLGYNELTYMWFPYAWCYMLVLKPL